MWQPVRERRQIFIVGILAFKHPASFTLRNRAIDGFAENWKPLYLPRVQSGWTNWPVSSVLLSTRERQKRSTRSTVGKLRSCLDGGAKSWGREFCGIG